MGEGDFDVVVAGAGPAGLVAACLVGQAGLRTALLTGTHEPGDDPRTVALMQPSIEILRHLELWPGDLLREAAPLQRLRLIDDTGSLLSAPRLVFDASEIGLEAFGWNVPLARLARLLSIHASRLGVAWMAVDADGLSLANDRIRVRLSGGSAIAARAVIAADGRNSKLRSAAGIAAEEWTYDQGALATSFGHSAPHRNVSSEYHRQAGPFTTVPLAGYRSSLVWMERPERARQLVAMNDDALAAEIQAAAHGELGLIGDLGPRKVFAMGGLTAKAFAANRVYLVGESAHAGPPIGAQGLNMSFRDAALAADLIAASPDPGATEPMRHYDAERRADVMPRQSVVDMMNRSLLTGFLPLEALRVVGLTALDAFGPLRRLAMRRGLGPPEPRARPAPCAATRSHVE